MPKRAPSLAPLSDHFTHTFASPYPHVGAPHITAGHRQQHQKETRMGTKFYISTVAINAQHMAAAEAIASVRHTNAHAAALELALRLINYQGASEHYKFHSDAARLIRLVAGYASPEKVLARMTQFALAYADEQRYEDDLADQLDYEMAFAFVKLAPKSKRGGYQRERTLRVIATLLRESVWSFAFRVALIARKRAGEKVTLLDAARGVAEELANEQANVALKEMK